MGVTEREEKHVTDKKEVASVHGATEKDAAVDQFVEKVNRGDFTFNESQVRGLVAALGVEDEVEPHVLGAQETSPTAGLTPATGSGGVPYEPDAATKETKDAAKAAKKRLDKGEYPDSSSVSPQRIQDKQLAAAVPDSK